MIFLRILHTADWHLGKVVNDFSMLEEQRNLLYQMIETIQTLDLDAVIIAGDLYDRALPPKEAVSLADEILTYLSDTLKIPILLIAGNHDSNERLEYGARLFTQNNLFIAGTLKEETQKVRINGVNFYLLPFADPAYVREMTQNKDIRSMEDVARYQIAAINKDLNPTEVNVLIAHGYVINGTADSVEASDSERPLTIGTAEYIPVSLLEDFDYVALGHLHKPQKVKESHIRYSGSLLKYSKSEANHKKQITLVELEKGNCTVTPLNLQPQHDMVVRRGYFKELLQESSQNYIFFELLDDTVIFDPMNQLRKKFPRAMGLEYINRKQLSQTGIQVTQKDLKVKSFPDLFCDFYEEHTGKQLTASDQAFISNEFSLAERSIHETN